MPHFIEFHDVCKFYTMGENRIAAADHISFYVDQGEFCIIVGPSGAGKTTVLNMLGGMDSCDEGEILLDGSKISEYNAKQLTTYRRYDVGFVFQFYNLVQNLTALENVIARALAKNPKILLCDEPTGALDYNTGKAVLQLLQDTCRKTGRTVIVITHNSALTAMADRVIRIKSGKAISNDVNKHPTPVEEIEW